MTEQIQAKRYERLAGKLQESLCQYSVGERLPSIRAFAAQHDVSINTVQLALKKLQSEGWVELSDRSGCRVLRCPVKPSRYIAIVSGIDLLRPDVSPFFVTIMARLREVLEKRQEPYRLYLSHAACTSDCWDNTTWQGLSEDRTQGRIKGVLAIATLPWTKFVHPFREQNIPVIGMDIYPSLFNAVTRLDTTSLFRIGIDALLRQGCDRIALIASGHGYATIFQNTLAQFGLDFYTEWTETAVDLHAQNSSKAALNRIWGSSKNKPNGLLIGDDTLLPGIDEAMRSMRIRVPEHLRVALATSVGRRLYSTFPLIRLECDPVAFADSMLDLLLKILNKQPLVDPVPLIGYTVVLP